MTNKKSSQLRDTAHHQLSRDEQSKFGELLEKLTPSASAYHEYRLRVNYYLTVVGPLLHRLGQHPLKGLKLRRSQLFNELEYLVAYVDDDWLHQIAPNCDAIASAMAGQQGDDGLLNELPPFVFLPESKRRARNKKFLSILEHEIVHINQAILGALPGPMEKRKADDLLDQFAGEMAAEYDAYFLQAAKWPTPDHIHCDLSRDHWCLLRGYTQALEHALFTLAIMDFPPDEVEQFLEGLSSSLLPILRRICVSEDLASWFQPRFLHHLAIAIPQVLSSFPDAARHPAFHAACEWLTPRLGATPKNSADSPVPVAH
jgi:hypothetical protein